MFGFPAREIFGDQTETIHPEQIDLQYSGPEEKWSSKAKGRLGGAMRPQGIRQHCSALAAKWP